MLSLYHTHQRQGFSPSVSGNEKKKLQLCLVLTLLIPDSSIGDKQGQITGTRGNHVNPEYIHQHNLTGDLRVSVERQLARDDVGVRLGVRQKPVGQQRERQVHGLRLAGGDLVRRDRGLTDQLASVVQQSGAVLVPEADLVGVLDGEPEVQGHVELDPEPKHVNGEVEVFQADGVDGGHGALGFEDGESQDHDQEDDGDQHRHRRRTAGGPAPASAAPGIPPSLRRLLLFHLHVDSGCESKRAPGNGGKLSVRLWVRRSSGRRKDWRFLTRETSASGAHQFDFEPEFLSAS